MREYTYISQPSSLDTNKIIIGLSVLGKVCSEISLPRHTIWSVLTLCCCCCCRYTTSGQRSYVSSRYEVAQICDLRLSRLYFEYICSRDRHCLLLLLLLLLYAFWLWLSLHHNHWSRLSSINRRAIIYMNEWWCKPASGNWSEPCGSQRYHSWIYAFSFGDLGACSMPTTPSKFGSFATSGSKRGADWFVADDGPSKRSFCAGCWGSTWPHSRRLGANAIRCEGYKLTRAQNCWPSWSSWRKSTIQFGQWSMLRLGLLA